MLFLFSSFSIQYNFKKTSSIIHQFVKESEINKNKKTKKSLGKYVVKKTTPHNVNKKI